MAFYYDLLKHSHISMASAAEQFSLDSIFKLPLSHDEIITFTQLHTELQKYFGDTKGLMRVMNVKCPLTQEDDRKEIKEELNGLLKTNLNLQQRTMSFRALLVSKPNQAQVKQATDALGMMSVAASLVSTGLYVAYGWAASGIVAVSSIPSTISAYFTISNGNTTPTSKTITLDEIVELLKAMEKNLGTMYVETGDMTTSVRLGEDKTADFRKHVQMMIDLCEIGQDALLGKDVRARMKRYEEDLTNIRKIHSESNQSAPERATIIDDHCDEKKTAATITPSASSL